MPTSARASSRPTAVVHPESSAKILKKSVQQAYTIYGFPAPPADHPDQEALDLLAVLLGDGRNARLVHTLREEKKLVWSVGASNITQEGAGIFAIFAECDVRNRPSLGRAVRDVLQSLRKNPPSAEEIRRAKNLMQTSWLQGYETFHNQAATVGAYALDRQLQRLERYLPNVLALGPRELNRVIRTYFSQELREAVVEP